MQFLIALMLIVFTRALLSGDEMRVRKRSTFSRSLEEGEWAQWSHHHPALLSFVTGALRADIYGNASLISVSFTLQQKKGARFSRGA